MKTSPLRPHRVALLVPSSNTVMENDLHAGLAKTRYSVHTARMYLIATTREDEIIMIDEHAAKGASDLGTASPDVLVFGCTSAGSLFGLDYDREVCRDLGKLAGCPTIGTISAVARALDRASFRRLAVITPYIEDLTRSVASSVATPERAVVAAHGMGIHVNVELADPTPEDILRFAEAKLTDVAMDGIFVSCTNFRALEAQAALEKRFGVPVVTSNSAVLQAVEAHFTDIALDARMAS